MIMNYENFTIKTQEALQEASSIANKNDNSEIGTEHVLEALLEQQDGLVAPIVERVGVPSIELIKKVRDLVAEQFDIEADEVTAESQIVDDLGADSLDVVDLISAVEDEFDVQIPDEKVEGIKTVGDIVAFIESFASED